MKNLLIYISPNGKFTREHEDLTRIQIDNSLDLGWRKEDLLLVANFKYGYNGVNAYVLEGDYNALDGNRSSKVLAINQLFKNGVIDDLYWFHDHDAFQLEPMKDPELGTAVAGFTTHGWSEMWNAGSFFFNGKAEDVFLQIYDRMIEGNVNEQRALTYLIKNNIDGINWRIKMLNITYNLGIYYVDQNLRRAEMPLLVAHFHPHKPRHLNLFRSLIPDRLMRIFNSHGIK